MTDMRIGGVYVDMGLNTAQFQKGVQKAKKEATGLGASLRRSLGGISREFNVGLGRGLLGGLAAGFSANAVKGLLDSATNIQNALKAAGLSGDELTKVYNRLFASAQKNQAPIEGLVTLYSRVSLAQKELGVSSEQIVGLVDTVGKAIKLSGGDAAQASGALLQLSQALGGGKIQAEEYNSLIDGMPGILQAAAAGIKEAGGSVAKLTALVKSGQVSSKAFFDGIQAGASVIDQRLAGAEQTVSGAFVRLQNVMVDTATRINDSTDASEILANFLNGPLTEAIREIGGVFAGVGDGPIAGFVGWINKATDAVLQAAADFGQASGLAKIGESYGAKPYLGPQRIQDRIDGAFAGTTYTTPKESRGGTELTVNSGTVTKPISLADYALPGGKGKGSGRGSRSRQDDYAREIEQIKERTAAIQAETAAMTGINPLVDDYGYALEKARSKQELMTAAQKAGKEITPQLAAEIDNAADAYASASAEADRLAEAQGKIRQSAEDAQQAARDFAGAMVGGLLEGKDASEVLSNALKQLASRFLNSGLDQLFGMGGGGGANAGSGGGPLGGLFNGILSIFGFAKGGIAKNGRPLPTFAKGGVSRSAAIFAEAGTEAAVPLPDGRSIPVTLSMPRLPNMPEQRPAIGNVVTINAPINAPGADSAALARVERSVHELGRNIPKMVDARTDTRQTRRTRA